MSNTVNAYVISCVSNVMLNVTNNNMSLRLTTTNGSRIIGTGVTAVRSLSVGNRVSSVLVALDSRVRVVHPTSGRRNLFLCLMLSGTGSGLTLTHHGMRNVRNGLRVWVVSDRICHC